MEQKTVQIYLYREKNRIGARIEDGETVWGTNEVEALTNLTATVARMSETKRSEIFGAINEETKAKRAG